MLWPATIRVSQYGYRGTNDAEFHMLGDIQQAGCVVCKLLGAGVTEQSPSAARAAAEAAAAATAIPTFYLVKTMTRATSMKNHNAAKSVHDSFQHQTVNEASVLSALAYARY